MNHPHIVKFSGGRSSGMMLLQLLEENLLSPKRGDVVIFNNTSAEHPDTYIFARKMKHLVEKDFNIPFFWVEYQTCEDASDHGSWIRKPTYRLVNDQPWSTSNPDGYRYCGEVFEELISATGYVPNMLSRNCTLYMKIFATNAFLTDWFAMKSGISRRGHTGDTVRITDQSVLRDHRRAGGRVPDDILLKKKQFVRQCPHFRPAQLWQDFTHADTGFDNHSLRNSIVGGKAELYGRYAVTYFSYLGIRADEAHRADKIRARIAAVKKRKERSLIKQPHREIVLTPLIENETDQQGVYDFWNRQTFDLGLPQGGPYSNCLYCPLKGRKKLAEIASRDLHSEQPWPVSIDWWIAMEEKYSRDLMAEGRTVSNKKVTTVGFFGASSTKVYATLKQEAETGVSMNHDAEFLDDDSYAICQCTD